MNARRIACYALPALLALAVPAWAEEGGPSQDSRDKIRKKMEQILELMGRNEKALLELSTGTAAKTRAVDVEVPPPPAGDGSGSGQDGGATSEGASPEGPSPEGRSGETTGESAVKTIEELLEGPAESGGRIPDEIKDLVEMIPL